MRRRRTPEAPPRRSPRGSWIGVVVMLAGAPAGAQSTETSTQAAAPATVTMEVVDADVRSVLQHIARVGGVPIAIGAGVEGRIDLVLDGVPVEAAMRIVLDAAGLEASRVGEVTLVRPASPAAEAPAGEAPPPAPIDALVERYSAPQDTLRKRLEGTDQTGTPPAPPTDGALAPASAPADTERPRPDYDGLEPRSPSAGEILIWVPRAIFFPVHLVMNYVVRIPIVWTLTRLEENYVFKRIERFITFRDGKSIIAPTFFGDFGLRPAFGLANNNRDLFFEGNDFAVSASYGGNAFVHAGVTNTTTVLADDSGQLRLFGNFTRRADQPYYGQGPFTSTDQRYNYRIQRIEAGWGLRAVLQDLSWIRFGMTFRDVDFGNAGQREDPTEPEPRTRNFNDLRNSRVGAETENIAEGCGSSEFRHAQRDLPYLPCGYEGEDYPSYRILESRIAAKVDTRDPDTEFQAGSGVLLEGFASFEFDPSDLSRNWIRFGGEAAAFWDFTGVGHTLALRVYGEFTERTGSVEDPIPFTELPTLGGIETMRGFLPRRFIGDSAFMSELSYRYPIWSLVDAELFASVGNVFDNHYAGFSLKRLHLSSGFSLRTSFTRDASLQLLVAFGTNRFEESANDNFGVDAIRFAFGYVQGF